MSTKVAERNALVFIVILLFFILSNACAQDAEGDYHHEVDGYVRNIPSRSVKAQSGSVRITESKLDYTYKFKLFDKLPVDFSVAPGYTYIYKTVSLALPVHLTEFSTDIQATLPFFNLEHTYLRIGVSPSFYSDNWTFNGEAFRIPNRYYAIYQPGEKWTFICGVAFFPKYEDSVLPVAGFIYKPNDKLIYDITPPRPNITYALSDKAGIFIEGGRLSEEYSVSRESSKNVKLYYVQEHFGGGARFKLNKFTEASVSAGGVFNHYLRYRDSGGKVSMKNGLYTEFRIQMNI